VKQDVIITDLAVITSMGPGLTTLWDGLIQKKTAIDKVKRFSTDHCISDQAALIKGLKSPGNRSLILNLSDKLITQLNDIPKDSHLITATTKAGIDLIESTDIPMDLKTNHLILSSLPHYLSDKLGLSDPGFNISSACASSTIAVAKAAHMISCGMADSILVCCLDVISRFVFTGFSCLQAMSDQPAKPFDKNRNGLTLGEGACSLLLMSRKRSEKENRKHLATVSGWGMANDATHLTAPARDGCGLKQAISEALETASLDANSISAINTHGTGTVYNDLMEIGVIRTLFGNRSIPSHSIKGSIGHTLGAAGGIEIALGTKILKEQLVPGTYGFKLPEDGAENLISTNHRKFSGDYLLTTNSGFGGTNAAVILKRGES